MNGNAALYQVAVALIPALLFGGAVLELRQRTPLPRNPRLLGLSVAGILSAGVIAEIVAIRGAIDPGIGDLGCRYLVLALTVGTAGLAIWIAAPPLRIATAGTRIQLGWREVGVTLVIVGIAGQFAITESLDHAEKRVALKLASEQVARASRELSQAEQIELAARTQLVSLARSTGSAPAVAISITYLHQLDDRVLRPVSNRSLTISNVGRHVRAGFRNMNAINTNFAHGIEVEAEGLGKAKRELLILAWRRLISAVAPTIGGRQTLFFATRRFRRTCSEAAFLECR